MRKTPVHVRQALFAIQRAAADGQLHALDAYDSVENRPVFLLCIKVPVPGTEDVDMVPVGLLFEEPAYYRYAPGSTGEGYRPLEKAH